jgi:hypothetical protein
MATKSSKQRRRKSDNAGFRISNGPVAQFADEERKSTPDFGDVADLPRAYGAPMLFAIARDPSTIFTYWSIDWPTLFGKNVPVDRQVHLRVHTVDGTQESSVAVEPMAGNSYLTVSQPRSVYRVEIGYYQPEDIWNSVAISNDVTMPPDNVAKDSDVDLATIPLHLSFQQLLKLFRLSNGAPLAETISRFQKRALSNEEHKKLSPEEREILRAMDLSLSEIAGARHAYLGSDKGETSRRRLEALLGFGSISSSPGFGGRTWSSGAA